MRATGDWCVRAAQPADKAFVVGLAARFADTRAAWRTYDEVASGTRRQLARAFDDPRSGETLFVAVDGCDEPVGFAFVVTQTDFFTGETHGHISEIATVADGGGIGSVLVAAAETWARDCGYRYLSLNVNDANAGARHFYTGREYMPEYRHLVKLL